MESAAPESANGAMRGERMPWQCLWINRPKMAIRSRFGKRKVERGPEPYEPCGGAPLREGCLKERSWRMSAPR
jgi:hypothetical protein